MAEQCIVCSWDSDYDKVGFSYKPKNYMDEAAEMTQENS